ncbi:MAG: hypothetical protein WDW38_006401 [Sanguina aurantia]
MTEQHSGVDAGRCTKANIAARAGHLQCLREVLLQDPCRAGQVLLAACEAGSWECVQCVCVQAATFGLCERTWFESVLDSSLETCIQAEHLECIRVLIQTGFAFERPMSKAAWHGKIDAMRCLSNCGVPFGVCVTRKACQQGHVDCLRFAIEQGADWHPTATSSAAREGHLDCLVYAHEHGAPWCDNTVGQAARGQITCLEYAHANGAVMSSNAMYFAARDERCECLRFLVERGGRFERASISDLQRHTRTITEAWVTRRSARIIQRGWRAAREAKRRHAVGVIEAAFLAWSCRPGVGRWYKRAQEMYLLHADSLS